MPDGRRLERGKLVFSVKECLFKAYYPATGYFLDFPEARVTFAPAAGVFEAALVSANAPSLAGRRAFRGCFGMAGGLVFAVMAVPI
jgi:4'-phosphopantetheinyl transferase EntD